MDQDFGKHLWPTISHQHINERIYELLLSKIIAQEFIPGQKLPSIEEIALMLGVSRTPVKEAVNRLAVEGLLFVVPRKGTFVTVVTPESIKELFDVRLMMELHAAHLAIRRVTSQDVAKLVDIVSRLKQFVENDHYTDYESYLQIDSLFHLTIVRLSGNSLLLRLYEGINLHVQVVRAYQKAPGAAAEAKATQEEHLAIVSALEQRNESALHDAVVDHVTNRERQFVAALKTVKNSTI